MAGFLGVGWCMSDWLAGCGEGAAVEVVGRMGIGISTKLSAKCFSHSQHHPSDRHGVICRRLCSPEEGYRRCKVRQPRDGNLSPRQPGPMKGYRIPIPCPGKTLVSGRGIAALPHGEWLLL